MFTGNYVKKILPLQGNKGMNSSFKQTINIFVTITRLTVEPRKKVQIHFLKNQFTRLQRDEFSVYHLSLEKSKNLPL